MSIDAVRDNESEPGPGGWAAVLRYGNHHRELSGMESSRTLGDLLILALVCGLEALTRPVQVDVHCPSRPSLVGTPGTNDTELLNRLAVQKKRHHLVWAQDVHAQLGGDHDRARLLATPSEVGARQRVEVPVTIEEALDKFLAHEREHVSQRTFAQYDDIIDLFRSCLDGYAYLTLDEDESRRFDEAYEQHADGKAFCRTFGPDKIPGAIGEFVGYFMARKVITTLKVLQATGPVIRKLAHWLADQDYDITTDDLESMLEKADAATRDLPAAERLRRKWNALCDGEAEYCEATVQEVLWVRAVEPGLVRFRNYEPDTLFIDVRVPREISDLVRPGWEIYVEAAEVDDEWRVSMIGTVYT